MNDVATETAETAPGRGHNQPPTPYDERRERTESIIENANVWLAECDEITSDRQAGRARDFLELIRQATEKNDSTKGSETAPLRQQVDAINSRYNSLGALLAKASDAVKALLKPWTLKLEAERVAKAAAEREKAERLAREADEAARSATTIEDQVAADGAAEAAKKAERQAARTAKERVGVKGEVAGRALGLRTQWQATAITDIDAALAHYKANAKVHELLLRLASAEARHGRRRILGFKIEAVQSVA